MNYLNSSLPMVVIFGRTNVGKSTLFNALIEKRKALTSDVPGTTRDANLGQVEWQRKKFTLVDTGGIIDIKFLTGAKLKTDDIESKVQKQARDYLSRADLILFLVDTRAGLLPADKQMVLLLKKLLQKNKKSDSTPLKNKKTRKAKSEQVILAANKADNPRLRGQIAEFNKLSLGEPLPISGASGSGTGDLLDEIIKKLPKKTGKSKIENRNTKSEIQNQINVCILGKPNVGKSSLVNAILGEERIIVSPIPHTTREPQDTLTEYKDNLINLIDTAGISKQGQKSARAKKTKNTLEKFSIKKSLAILKKADIALLVIDINEILTHQDSKLVEEIVKTKTSLIIIANKWDLVKKHDTKHYTKFINGHFPFAVWVPIQFISALTGAKVKNVLDLIAKINQERKIELTDNQLSKFLNRIVKLHAPAKGKGTRFPYIYKIKQTETDPPVFSVKIGAKDNLLETYLNFIINRLRDKYGFLGTPITMYVEKRKRIHGLHEKPKNLNPK